MTVITGQFSSDTGAGSSEERKRLYTLPCPKTPLRVGLLLDSLTVPAWIAHVVADIQASGFARIELVVLATGQKPRPSAVRRVYERLASLLYDAYEWREVAHRRGHDSPFQPREIGALPGDASVLRVASHCDGNGQRIDAADLERVRAEQLDVLLKFGFGTFCGGILTAAKHGVWSYRFGDCDEHRGDPPLFREIHERNPVSCAVLQRLGERPEADEVLYHSWGSTHPHSIELSRYTTYWKSSNFVMRCLRELARCGALGTVAGGSDQTQRFDRRPGNLRMSQFLARNVIHKARALVRNRSSVQHWSIAWRRGALLDPAAPRLESMQELHCPRGHFYADPFLFRHDGRDWLFLEDYEYARGKADIVVVPWGQNGPADVARRVLELPEHLSYPFVFDWEEHVYMVPEIGETGGPVNLFRARGFPGDWEFVCELLTGLRAVDATLHPHDGRWYLFANIVEAGGSENDELFLFSADTPLGPFQPHPQNPIVSDVRRARPAGRLFERGGRLIRPGQDCAGDYGRAVVFNEVLELSPERYAEHPISRLAPDWAQGLTGCHTYAALGDLEVVDCKRQRLRWGIGG